MRKGQKVLRLTIVVGEKRENVIRCFDRRLSAIYNHLPSSSLSSPNMAAVVENLALPKSILDTDLYKV
jgi:hypothetical protein